jgi:RNA polymerase sigma factor (sigma-70 family)
VIEMTVRADVDNEVDLVRQYLNEIGSVPLLSAVQEIDLAKRIEAGLYAEHLLHDANEQEPLLPARRRQFLQAVAEDGRAAKDHMIRANLRLVVAVVRKSPRRGLPLLDAIQNGNLGLIRAVEKFDYTKGFKFSTYATWWIRQATARGAAETSRAIRLPAQVADELSKIQGVEHALTVQKGREPTMEELATATGKPTQRVAELRRIGRTTLSLDTPLGDTDGPTLGEAMETAEPASIPETVERHALIATIRAAVATLPPREAQVITLRYGLRTGQPCTLRETAAQLRISPERARQLQIHALDRLRAPDHRPALVPWAS